MDGVAWQATVRGGRKEMDTTKQLSHAYEFTDSFGSQIT